MKSSRPTSGSVNAAVDRLQALGLVSREVDGEDSRSRGTGLSGAG